MNSQHVVIDASLVRRLIASQFPKWKELRNYSPLPSLRRRSGTGAGTGAGTKEKKIA
jgi:hypothetical protein